MPVNRDDEVVLCLHRFAFTEARRIHLCEDDALDCAMEMVLHALTQAQVKAAGGASSPPVSPERESVAVPASITAVHIVLRADLSPEQTARWLRRCARNFALNYRRRVVARCRYEVRTNSYGVAEGIENTVTVPIAPPAEYDALNRLLHQDVFAAMHELPPHAREVFARFHLQGDSLAEIGLSSGKSADAIKKQIHRLRRHVCATLVRQGHGMSERDFAP